MDTNEEINNNIKFLNFGENFTDKNVISYIINSKALNDKCNEIAVLINGNDKEAEVKLPSDNWSVVVNNKKAGINALEKIEGNIVSIAKKSVFVLIK